MACELTSAYSYDSATDAWVAYFASGLDSPDALAAAARAGSVGAPVLLTMQDALSQATAQELARLDPDRVVLLGGRGAVTDAAKAELGRYGAVTRVAGKTRYETAAKIAEDHPTAARVYMASGQYWPDALAEAARAAVDDAPILLVKVDEVPPGRPAPGRTCGDGHRIPWGGAEESS